MPDSNILNLIMEHYISTEHEILSDNTKIADRCKESFPREYRGAMKKWWKTLMTLTRTQNSFRIEENWRWYRFDFKKPTLQRIPKCVEGLSEYRSDRYITYWSRRSWADTCLRFAAQKDNICTRAGNAWKTHRSVQRDEGRGSETCFVYF